MSVVAAALWSVVCGASASAQSSGPADTTRVTAVSVQEVAGGAVVVLTANGALSASSVQVLPGQPVRLYVDFQAVRPAVPAVTPGRGPVLRVRVALNNMAPLVSRVVVDLRERVAHRLDTSESARGVVRLLLGAAAEARDGRQTASAPRPTSGSTDAPKTSDTPGASAKVPEGLLPAPGAESAPSARTLLSAADRVSLALSRSVDTRLPLPLPLVGGDDSEAKPTRGRRRPSPAEERQERARLALTEARTLIHQGRYDAAAEAASRARDAVPDDGAGALVYGRAMLERYRETVDATHLGQALEALRSVDGAALSERDRVDLILGLALGLYLNGDFRAAAGMFATSFEAAETADPELRDRAVDWWATAIARHAQALPLAERTQTFEQMLLAVTDEARHDPASTAAGYWAVVAARGMGDLDRAWDTAVAHWVRAQLCRDGGDALRQDLDTLMSTTIIPERARRLADESQDPAAIEAMLTAEWSRVKEKWSRQ